jgi:hypothetical protein
MRKAKSTPPSATLEAAVDAVEGKSRAVAYRYTHAKHDPAHCTILGMFRALRRGDRQHKKLDIKGKYGKAVMHVTGDKLLGADDLHILQGLVAMAAPLTGGATMLQEVPKTLDQIYLRNAIDLKGDPAPIMVVTGTLYQLNKEIDLGNSTSSYRKIRECIARLCTTSIVHEDGGKRRSFRLLSHCGTTTKEAEAALNPVITAADAANAIGSGCFAVALNPLLTAAVLGKSINLSGSHARIEMFEVRTINHEATRLIHQYLCAVINPGETKTLSRETLRARIWPERPEKANLLHQHHYRLRETIKKLVPLGWRFVPSASSRKNRAQRDYQTFEIHRPSKAETAALAAKAAKAAEGAIMQSVTILDAEGEPMSRATPPLTTLALKSPAVALRTPEDLDDTKFAEYVARQPQAGLKYGLARLTIEQLAACARAVPAAALRYATALLGDWQIEDCARAAPAEAIRFATARLSPKQFVTCLAATLPPPPTATAAQLDEWINAEPARAWRFVAQSEAPHTPVPEALQNARQWLTADQFDAVIRAMPGDALRFVAEGMTPVQIDACTHAQPAGAVQYAAAQLTEELLNYCVRTVPVPTLKYAATRLSERQVVDCVSREPGAALQHAISILSADQRNNCISRVRQCSDIDEIVHKYPAAALIAECSLTKNQLAYCVDHEPALALKHAYNLLSRDQLDYCTSQVR